MYKLNQETIDRTVNNKYIYLLTAFCYLFQILQSQCSFHFPSWANRNLLAQSHFFYMPMYKLCYLLAVIEYQQTLKLTVKFNVGLQCL